MEGESPGEDPNKLPKVEYTEAEKEQRAEQAAREGGSGPTTAFMRKETKKSSELPVDPGPDSDKISRN